MKIPRYIFLGLAQIVNVPLAQQQVVEKILDWKPHFRCWPRRDAGRPVTLWEDSISDLAGGDWTTYANDEHLWLALEEGFVHARDL